MRILLLGGTGEARALAGLLQQAGADFIYSLAGVTQGRRLPFCSRRGGFGGVDGLAEYLRAGPVDLVIDASHPYAATISEHAAAACRSLGLPLWAWRRPEWRPESGDRWQPVANWPVAAQQLGRYRRPLLTLGSTPLRTPYPVPGRAQWLLRCLPGWHGPLPPRTDLIMDAGPFTADGERALLVDRGIDVLVSRNSGGNAVAAKIQACRELRLPVLMLDRPVLPRAERLFTDIEQLFTSIKTLI